MCTNIHWFLQPQAIYYVLHTVQQVGGEYLVQQAKFGVLLLRVFTARVRVFLHQENISLFTLQNEQKYYYKAVTV